MGGSTASWVWLQFIGADTGLGKAELAVFQNSGQISRHWPSFWPLAADYEIFCDIQFFQLWRWLRC